METNTTIAPATNSELNTPFAVLKADYFQAHEALSTRSEKDEPAVDSPDPDYPAVIDKLHILLHDEAVDEAAENAIRSIIADIARLSGAEQFNAGSWLLRWIGINGGYVVQDGKVKLISPTDNCNGYRAKLLAELDSLDGKEAINAYIVEQEASRGREPNDWQGLCNALETATANANQPTDDDATCDRNADIQLKAVQALMLHPAKDMAAFSCKMEKFIEHDCGSYSDHIKEPIMEALLTDTRRLSGVVKH